MQPKQQTQNTIYCIMLWTKYVCFCKKKLFWENENWTFLKMSKSANLKNFFVL